MKYRKCFNIAVDGDSGAMGGSGSQEFIVRSDIGEAVIEQNNDENGIIWPVAIAPYHIIITLVNLADKIQVETAEGLYSDLTAMGIETLLDDSDERAGVKFKDADLIGVPVRITVGKRAAEGIVEYKERQWSHKEELSLPDAVNRAGNRILL